MVVWGTIANRVDTTKHLLAWTILHDIIVVGQGHGAIGKVLLCAATSTIIGGPSHFNDATLSQSAQKVGFLEPRADEQGTARGLGNRANAAG